MDQQLARDALRRSYLITYSQVDKSKFPTRESFAECIVKHFNEGKSKAEVHHYACCLEDHEDGGEHYHVALKLSAPKRWLSVKEAMMEHYNVSVHFSASHDSYYYAYKYISKSDEEVFKSPGHPNLDDIGSPRTKKCIAAYRKKTQETRSANSAEPSAKKPKRRRLSNMDVADFIVKNNINTKI